MNKLNVNCSLTVEQTSDGKNFIAQLEQIPQIIVQGDTFSGTISELFLCLAGYEVAFPGGLKSSGVIVETTK